MRIEALNKESYWFLYAQAGSAGGEVEVASVTKRDEESRRSRQVKMLEATRKLVGLYERI